MFENAELPQPGELSLFSLNLRSFGLVALDQSKLGRQLIKLNLSANFIHDHDLPLLLTPAKLQILDLSYTAISTVQLEKVLANLNHTGDNYVDKHRTMTVDKKSRPTVYD